MTTRNAALLRIVIFLAILTSGAFAWETHQHAGWQETTGQVAGHSYSLYIRYQVNGHTFHHNTRIGILDQFGPLGSASKGDTIALAYNPANPSDVVINTFSAKHPLSVSFGFLLVLISGSTLFILNRRS